MNINNEAIEKYYLIFGFTNIIFIVLIVRIV